MQIIRTIVWVLITAALVAFVAMNWEQVPVNFWPVEGGPYPYIYVKWPVGLIAIFFFLLGAAPMWLLSKAGRWRMSRRMTALENSVRVAVPTPVQVAGETELSQRTHREATPTGNYPGDPRED